jgi:hypothetical protein
MYSVEMSSPVGLYPRLANSSECRPLPHGTSRIRAPRLHLSALFRKSTSARVASGGMHLDHNSLATP